MKEHYRAYPEYAACGLNCGLCPRYHTQGTSRCPGCGGPGFYHKHPSCAIINCGQRHGGVEYCVLCGEFPCRRYMDEHPVFPKQKDIKKQPMFTCLQTKEYCY